MTVTAYDWVAYHAGTRRNEPALTDLGTNRRFDWAQLHDRVARLARALRDRCGVFRGDRVASLVNNSTDVFEMQFACARLGAVFVPVNWRLAVPELTYIMNDCQPVVLFYDPEFDDAALTLQAACGIRHRIGRDPNDSAYERLIARETEGVVPERVTHDDTMTILYTSGTTGRPKGVIITYGMRFWQAINNGPARISSNSVMLAVLPLFHAGGLDVWCYPILHWGGHVSVMRAFEPAQALRLLSDRELGVTHFVGVPAHWLFMSQQPGFETATFNPGLIAYVGAAPMPMALLEAWAEQGLAVSQLYGMTETIGTAVSLRPEEAISHAGSAGRPCLYLELRLVRADGTEAQVGEVGEIWMRGPSVTPGYWKLPEASTAALTDGWFRSGDAATKDKDGYLTIVDRWKDMYISGGENVYPAEVEDAIYRLPAIAEAAVIGVSDDRWGEFGRAIVVLKPGQTLTEADIVRHCEANLARYKLPRSVRFVDALPRNATGKVYKPTLRAQFGAV